jgi:effector-binding domain-containing protein
MLIKQLFNTPADITSDEEEQTLTIRIRSLSAPRYNKAINELCEILNQTETIFPGTELKMIFKNQAD